LINARRTCARSRLYRVCKTDRDDETQPSEFVPLSPVGFLPVVPLIPMNPTHTCTRTLIARTSVEFMSNRFILHAVNHTPGIPGRARSCPTDRSRAILHFYPHSTICTCTILYLHIPTLTSAPCCKLDAAVALTIKDDRCRREGKLASARSCPRLHRWLLLAVLSFVRHEGPWSKCIRERVIYRVIFFIQDELSNELSTLLFVVKCSIFQVTVTKSRSTFTSNVIDINDSKKLNKYVWYTWRIFKYYSHI